MAHPRRTRSSWLLALLAPLLAAGVACVLLRREPAAFATSIVLWHCACCALAVLSVLNTTS